MDYTEIKTFEDACQKLGINPEDVKVNLPEGMEADKKALEAHAKLVIIAKALNGDWTPDWNNGKWDKYYPWFDMRSSASGGFSFVDFDYWITHSTVGSRLCFASSQIAEYAGKQFESLYKDYFVIE